MSVECSATSSTPTVRGTSRLPQGDPDARNHGTTGAQTPYERRPPTCMAAEGVSANRAGAGMSRRTKHQCLKGGDCDCWFRTSRLSTLNIHFAVVHHRRNLVCQAETKGMKMGTVLPKTWKTWERCIAIHDDFVIKRELHEDELIRRPNGTIVRPFWTRERLQNEAATLQFISRETTIPVPKCRLYTKDGIIYLETERITNGVTLEEIEETSRDTAVAAVHQQLDKVILPQLRALRRNYIGSVDSSLPVFPPQRVYHRDKRHWERITSESSCFVLCHNDLGPQNIMICPHSFQIVAILDWEFAGYFPPYFELPLWSAFDWTAKRDLYDNTTWRQLAFFGLKLEDLKDCIPPP